MSSISLPVTGPSPSTAPRLVDAVSGSSARAVASFEAGSMIRADDRRHGEIPFAARHPVQDADHADPAQGAERGGDMAVGPGAADGEDVLGPGDGDATLEQGPDAVDDVGRQLGEVGEGLLPEASVLAPGLADEDRGPAVAVRYGLEMERHGTPRCCVFRSLWHNGRQPVNLHVT